MLLSIWGKFRDWVSLSWNQTTFFIVVGLLVTCALLLLSSYLKKNFNKGKKIKWGPLFFALVLLGIVALLSFARYV